MRRVTNKLLSSRSRIPSDNAWRWRPPLNQTVEWAAAAAQADPADQAFFLALAEDLKKLLAGTGPVNIEDVA